jgi:pyrroline-5-carboxylate reductase
MAVRLLVLGGGNMGSALITGLIEAGWDPVELAVVDPSEACRSRLQKRHPTLDVRPAVSAGLAEGSDAVLAVKPEAADAACRAAATAGAQRVLSVVAGLPAARLESWLPERTPALIGAGVAAMSGGSHVRVSDLEWAEGVLSAVGTVVRVPERHLDAVTGLSGSGPAYVFLLAEALVEAGVLCGLPRDLAGTLVTETLRGSAALLSQEGADPSSLRASVTSPAGTTAAGLRALEARGVRSAFLEAVASATERARQLGHSAG